MSNRKWVLGLMVLIGAGCAAPHLSSDELQAHYADGISFSSFLMDVEPRRAVWTGNYEAARPDSLLLARARAVPGRWRLLVVTAPWCTDSAHSLPYVAKFVDEMENLNLRLVDRATGRAIMNAHLTPDGRPATPTYLLLDSLGREAGCIVEMPRELAAWWMAEGKDLSDDAAEREKTAWYSNDAGTSIWGELVDVMEGAAAGDPVCRSE